MSKLKNFVFPLFVGVALISAPASGQDFNVPSGDLRNALEAYMKQAGVTVIYSPKAVAGRRTHGISGSLSPDAALSKILSGTGLTEYRTPEGDVGIVHDASSQVDQIEPLRLAQATAPTRPAVETVTVTSSKLGGADVQSIPIAITALSQEQLTSRQIAGGPDLVKEVPNLTFSKTNFTGYNIQIRGIGTQAISVTTDPAVAVAFNDTPFIRNHFFEQEFYDVSQAEVLRGPQGTLYGRNATAGVVNVISAKPTDQFEAMLSADWGNFHNRRYEGMVNLPLVDDRLDLRVAGEWTKRDGYSFNEITNLPIDGRDLWSSRVTLGWRPLEGLQTYLVWEHFQENDDRLRSAKQLCKTDPGLLPNQGGGAFSSGNYLSQGCLPVSLYSPEAFEVPNGFSLPYYAPLQNISVPVQPDFNPYAEVTQSRDLRVIQSTIDPIYKAKNDIVELNADYAVKPALTFYSQTAFNHDFLYSAEDYNRFNTAPGAFVPSDPSATFAVDRTAVSADGTFCDPQLGCSNRLVAEDLSDEHAWQASQEFRLVSNFAGPLNFSIGGNYLHYETEENYYVFINSLSLYAAVSPRLGASNFGPYVPGVSDNHQCLSRGDRYGDPASTLLYGCIYMDPNPLSSLNNEGHNYFLNQNPYTLNSYAGFGEVYYNLTPDLKFTGGLRWTEDNKHFLQIPSWLAVPSSWGYPVLGIVDQHWGELTGRAALNWTPKISFTDQTLIYGSFAHGYKAGGANPPGAVFLDSRTSPVHPPTFAPEFINAVEVGTKNTLLDGEVTLNGTGFYYDYKGYQISEIVDRSAVNLNFDAKVNGAELEASWEPTPGLKFSFAGGYEHTTLATGSRAIDLMDRTAGQSGWVIVKPTPALASNCILPLSVIEIDPNAIGLGGGVDGGGICVDTYVHHLDPVTEATYVPYPGVDSRGNAIPDYPGFNPLAPEINNGEGFYKDLSHNELPNAPHYTASFTAEYTLPVSQDWAATVHSDFYWQSDSFARVFNDRPYDQIHGYTNVNLALILTSGDGWQVLGYLKNIFNTTAITGDFLNSDDSGLTTNVFLTDPRLFGVRITRTW